MREFGSFGRRCGWCGVPLRWWQANLCRVCSFHVRYDHPSPPCAESSRWDGRVDGCFRKQRRELVGMRADGS